MDIDNLSYLQPPLKEKVEQLFNQSSLNDDQKSVINEVLDYFTKKIQQLEEKYNIKFSGDDSLLVNGELISGSKKRLFSSMSQEGDDAMAIDSIPVTPITDKLSSFINLSLEKKPSFKSYLYNINYVIHDVSFMNPRRLFNLVLTQECFIILYPNEANNIELVIPYGAISDIICVPVPETATKQWCVSLVINKNYQPKIIKKPPTDLTNTTTTTTTNNKKGNKKSSRKNTNKPAPSIDTTSSSTVTATNHEIYIFKFNDNKHLKIYENNSLVTESDQDELDNFGFKKVDPSLCNKSYLFDLFKKYIWPNNEKEILEPNPSVFVSKKKSMSNHTKNKSHNFHINCYYKAKEGFLFLLNEGIFYGAKKPSLYFPMNAILSIKVSNVTSRTFNLNIRRLQYTSSSESQGPANKKLKSENDSSPSDQQQQQQQQQQTTEEENFEFSMIDSVEFDAIMDYIRKHKTEWSTNRNGEFGVDTEDIENSEPQNDDDETMDEDKKSNKKGGVKGKAKGNKKGEAQNIFTFVDEDESNDEDYHPDDDSDSEDSDEDSDIDLDKTQEKEDMENDKEVLKSMNEGNKDLEDSDENDEIAKSTRSKKTKKNTTTKTSPEKSKTTTTDKAKEKKEPFSPMMEDKTDEEEEEGEISAISSNVEEISISSPDPSSNPSNSSSTKRTKRKSSNPKKMTTTTPKNKASSSSTTTTTTTKRKYTKHTKSDNNDTSSSTTISVNNTAEPSAASQEKTNKHNDGSKKKQLTINDLFSKAANNNKNKTTSPIQINHNENKDDDDDDEEDEILFE
ncbi:hypothetical protein PIROE2DRAFT_61313 [Piromyces sp. E2]|nr:hypothetical protein PIROE2DRAFT_61313 [Piromyces sp. E2]|eukprot:OUM63367.1 hypothetical protein PIROE2DRAFT_61313 [Piromyces sp. E2]